MALAATEAHWETTRARLPVHLSQVFIKDLGGQGTMRYTFIYSVRDGCSRLGESWCRQDIHSI